MAAGFTMKKNNIEKNIKKIVTFIPGLKDFCLIISKKNTMLLDGSLYHLRLVKKLPWFMQKMEDLLLFTSLLGELSKDL